MSDELAHSYVAQILTNTGQFSGMGMVVGRNHVLTSAHVVNHALRRDFDAQEAPRSDQPVRLRFPIPGDLFDPSATVTQWCAPASSTSVSDYCVLALSAPVPDELRIARFAKAKCGAPFLALRSQADDTPLEWVEGVIAAPTSGGLYQVTSKSTGGDHAFIEPGFSGGPAISAKTGRVLGMILRANVEEGIAQILPSQALARACEDVRIDRGSSCILQFFAAALLLVAFICIVVAAWPRPIVARIYDAKTNDQILRDFKLHRGEAFARTGPGATECRLDDKILKEDSEWRIVCDGFYGGQPKLDDTSHIYKFYIPRIKLGQFISDPTWASLAGDINSYRDTLKFDPWIAGQHELRISENEFNERMKKNDDNVDPSSVKLVVYNSSRTSHADVFLGQYQVPRPTKQDLSVVLIPSIPPQSWTTFEQFSIPQCAWIVGVSYNGRPAKPLLWDAMYRKEFALLTVADSETGDEPNAVLLFSPDHFLPPECQQFKRSYDANVRADCCFPYLDLTDPDASSANQDAASP